MDLRRLLIGLAFVAVGVVLVLQRTDVIADFNLWQLWPLLLIGWGIALLAERSGSSLGGVILIAVGIFFLVGTILPGSTWTWVWPLALVGIGIWIITQRNSLPVGGGNRDRRSGEMSHDPALNLVTIFRDHSISNDAAALRGGSIVTVLGELHLDLRDAHLNGPSETLDITTVLGETEVLVPRDWSVTMNSTAVLGEVNDRTVRPTQVTAETPGLVVRVTSILGEVTVRQ